MKTLLLSTLDQYTYINIYKIVFNACLCELKAHSIEEDGTACWYDSTGHLHRDNFPARISNKSLQWWQHGFTRRKADADPVIWGEDAFSSNRGVKYDAYYQVSVIYRELPPSVAYMEEAYMEEAYMEGSSNPFSLYF